MGDVTLLLRAASSGDAQAGDQLMALIYPELKRLACSRLRRSGEITLLDPTSLVHEAWERFRIGADASFPDRRYFLSYAAKVMRTVVIDAARTRAAERRGGAVPHVPLDTLVSESVAPSGDELLRVHEALDELALLEPRLAQVVEMRFFGGLSEAEVAEALDVTVRTVQRDWKKARLLLAGVLR
jgi:RNA polymerase sigma factor (TIGR02999 family)